MTDQDKKKTELWAVLRGKGGDGYMMNITRVIRGDADDIILPTKETVLKALATGHVVVVGNPAYEFATPMGRTPEGGIGKSSFTLPVGMMLEKHDFHLVNPSSIYFFEDMTPFDRAEHTKYYEDAVKSAAEARKKASPLSLISNPNDPRIPR